RVRRYQTCHWPNNQGQYALHTLFELNNCTVLNIKQLNQPCAFHLQQLIPFSLHSSPTNSLIVTVVPSFGTLVNSILPPCASTISFEIESPNPAPPLSRDRKSTRLNSSHVSISYAVFCLKKKKQPNTNLISSLTH